MQISVSCLSASNVKNFLNLINQTTADYIHIDVMDGIFVEPIKFSLQETENVQKLTTKPLDIHLMVKDVIASILIYRTLNPAFLTFHLEAVEDPKNIIELIRSFNIKPGISIKPDTDLELILPYLKYVDLVLVMSVEPGKGGQMFLEQAVERIRILKEYIIKNNLNTLISVDGGVNLDTVDHLIIKPDIIVMGSALSNAEQPESVITKIKKTS